MVRPFLRFTVLYAALFAAFGVVSPFLPALLQDKGLGANAIGVVLGLGSAVRLLSGPAFGRLADRTGAVRTVLVALLAVSAVVAVGYSPARELVLLALVSILHAAVLAPLTPLSDTLAVAAAGAGRFEYGWLRGAGSAAFIAASAGSGALVGRTGLWVVVWLNAGLLAVAALCAAYVPAGPSRAEPQARPDRAGAWRDLLALPGFLPLMCAVALVGGSHALHDGFAVIRWQAAGMSTAAAGVLWGLSVAAEVIVFLFLGRPLIDRLGPGGAAVLSAAAGIVRWSVTAWTAAVPAIALVEPLHGLTFALLHLAVMRVIAETVPPHLAATAQAFYGTLALGAAGTVLTFASGPLYGRLGAEGFWVMAALCAAALPFALAVRRTVPA